MGRTYNITSKTEENFLTRISYEQNKRNGQNGWPKFLSTLNALNWTLQHKFLLYPFYSTPFEFEGCNILMYKHETNKNKKTKCISLKVMCLFYKRVKVINTRQQRNWTLYTEEDICMLRLLDLSNLIQIYRLTLP